MAKKRGRFAGLPNQEMWIEFLGQGAAARRADGDHVALANPAYLIVACKAPQGIAKARNDEHQPQDDLNEEASPRYGFWPANFTTCFADKAALGKRNNRQRWTAAFGAGGGLVAYMVMAIRAVE
jgi:hypothetical protein